MIDSIRGEDYPVLAKIWENEEDDRAFSMITELKDNEIFVFGSNEAGIHGAGAARQAWNDFGAMEGIGAGLEGQSYAIPTKDKNIQTLPLSRIEFHVKVFFATAQDHPDTTFLVTAIGCGLAGYQPSDIAPMFKGAPSNVVLPDEFKEFLVSDTVTLIIERVAMDADPKNFSPKSGIQSYTMTIPRDWKVTYGPPIDGTDNSEGPFCLRVFEDDNRMRAVIFNVVGFRAEELDWKAVDDETGPLES